MISYGNVFSRSTRRTVQEATGLGYLKNGK